VIQPETLGLKARIEARARARAAKRGIWKTRAYQGEMHITSFHANAPGPDSDNLNGEYMRICNVSAEPLNISGWKLQNRRKHELSLPNITIPAGHTIQVFSGAGTHQTDPSLQLQVFLNATEPVWNNAKDRAMLLDNNGEKVDWRIHAVSDPSKVTD